MVEKICESDYQNIYRITDGVLLIINKFKYMSFPNDEYPHIYKRDNKRIWKQYTKGCQPELRELTIDYTSKYNGWFLPKGSVIYGSRPVQIVPKLQWDYQIKMTGTAFNGNHIEMLKLLSVIDNIISESGEQYGNEM